jgi:hypothetical protein
VRKQALRPFVKYIIGGHRVTLEADIRLRRNQVSFLPKCMDRPLRRKRLLGDGGLVLR